MYVYGNDSTQKLLNGHAKEENHNYEIKYVGTDAQDENEKESRTSEA